MSPSALDRLLVVDADRLAGAGCLRSRRSRAAGRTSAPGTGLSSSSWMPRVGEHDPEVRVRRRDRGGRRSALGRRGASTIGRAGEPERPISAGPSCASAARGGEVTDHHRERLVDRGPCAHAAARRPRRRRRHRSGGSRRSPSPRRSRPAAQAACTAAIAASASRRCRPRRRRKRSCGPQLGTRDRLGVVAAVARVGVLRRTLPGTAQSRPSSSSGGHTGARG